MSPRDRALEDVAHDLRTPLNAIKTWTYVLEGQLPGASPQVQRALEGIRHGVQQQAELIEALLGPADT